MPERKQPGLNPTAHVVRYELSHQKVETMAESRVTITVSPVGE